MPIGRVVVLLASVSALFVGCGTLPDGKPFADATSSLATSVVASGKAVTDSMTDAGGVAPSDKAAYDKLVKDFETAWSDRISAAQAAVRYSESIADLISAGSQGAETAGKVADSLKSLAEAVNIPVAAPAVGAAGDIARFIFARIAIVRASEKLESAVAQAQPAVDRIAEHIVTETDKHLKPILLEVYKNIRSGIKTTYDEDDNFAMQARKRREQQRKQALQDPAALAKLEEYDRIQASVAASLEERDRKLDQAATTYKTRLQLVNALSNATLSWAQAHRDLAVAIKEKRKVSVSELRDTISELRALTKKVSEL